MSTDKTEQKKQELQPDPQAISAAEREGQAVFADHVSPLHKRSVGLRLFDIMLYPIITNFAVFAVSVGLTYLSKHGADREGGKLVFGKFGEMVHSRTSPVRSFFKKVGCSEKSANDYTTVAFSFIDGTLFAPLVKLLEDRREKIAHWIDDRLGTTKDDSVYEAEPKQSWRSVVEGRIATSAIVVPTALVLDKKGLNDKMFNGWGGKLANYIERTPSVRRFVSPKLILPKLSNIIVFEAFYTSVCTAGLYFISRFVASKHPPKQHALATPSSTTNQLAPSDEALPPADSPAPQTRISHVGKPERLAAPALATEITA